MDKVEQAFKEINRADFLPREMLGRASDDTPLPIGYGQTISQPSTVRKMLQWLDAQSGDSVLDIGSGSGWTTALLSQIVGGKGQVYAVEKIPELVDFGRNNVKRMSISNAQFFQSGTEFGLSEYSPYDRILVSAAAQELPYELLDQLKIGGKLIIPIENDILEITKTTDHDYQNKVHTGFVFVPLL